MCGSCRGKEGRLQHQGGGGGGGGGGLKTEVGLRSSIDRSVADPVKAVTGVKDQEISLPLSHTLSLLILLQTFLWWLMRCLS